MCMVVTDLSCRVLDELPLSMVCVEVTSDI